MKGFVSCIPLLAAAAQATPFTIHPRSTNCNKFGWTPCEFPGASVDTIECGTLAVPLDYTVNRPNETLSLDLQRIPATKSPKKGSILLNFGGPGTDGSADLAAFGERMLAATGGYHDLINVVPRGTGRTLSFSCYPDAVTRALTTPDTLASNASDAAVGRVWADAQLFNANCFQQQNLTGDLIGTAFVARDLMQIVDALGEDGLLRYWGVSYGSLLGTTVAAMFPERMDKVIIDGVVNPFEYYTNTEVELFTDTDAAFTGFCKGCVASPEACPLALGGNLTAAQLEAQLYAFIDEIKYRPFYIGPQLVDYSSVKAIIFSQLYFPNVWPQLSLILGGIITRDPAVLELLPGAIGTGGGADPNAPDFTEAQYGIKCSDVRTPPAESLEAKLDIFNGRTAKSRIAGDAAANIVARCAQWPLPAKERYMGDFNVQTKNPMLIIGNTFDPVTPLVSARNVSETIKTSVLLNQDTYGHDSLIIGSLCTAKAIRSYFVEGKLPEEGTVCGTDVKLFDGTNGWDAIITALEAESLEV